MQQIFLCRVLFIFIYTIDICACIIFGKNVKIDQFPYHVSLHLNDEYICGGVIINESSVLTAAHCVLDENSLFTYTIRAGTSTHLDGQEYLVVNVIIHEQYDKTDVPHEYDIALLKIFGKFKFSPYLKPIAFQNSSISDDTICQVCGWGFTGKEQVSRILKAVNVSLVNAEQCDYYYINKITTNMVCARSLVCPKLDLRYQEVSKGDSGGPLICNNILIGIVSRGRYFDPDSPTIFTSVPALFKWIEVNKFQERYCLKRKHKTIKS